MVEEDEFFCERCGMQLFTVNEISTGICTACKKKVKEDAAKQSAFFCKICGVRLSEMKEIAQGICGHCKASIIRKLK